MRLRLPNSAAQPGLIQKKFRPNSIPPTSALWIYPRAQQRSVAAHTGAIGLPAGKASSVPLPDFFIGAHAELMGWKLATRDVERYRRYFPAVELIEPASASRLSN